MNNLKEYIIEKLKINKEIIPHYNYYPKNYNELRSLVEKLLKERGPNADLNDIDVSNLYEMSELFKDLDPHKINISEWNVSKVRNMEYMFCLCKNLECDLSKWDVHSVWNMTEMFDDCEKFNCDLSGWDVSNLKTACGMFNDCGKFDSDLDKWNTKELTNPDDVESMFDNCTSLKKIPQWYHDLVD